MLLTCFYMAASIIQTRRLSFLKLRIRDICIGNKSHSSIVFNIKPSKDQNGDCSRHDKNESSISSNLCFNKDIAKLDELLWYQENMKVYTIYPQQQVDLSDWLMFPLGKTLFPLYSNNWCRILSEPELRMHILVEMEYHECLTENRTYLKLEDYGVIKAWLRTEKMNLILETDIEHITSFISVLMQGQHYVNDGFFLLHIQSIQVSGNPCTEDTKQGDLILDQCLINIINNIHEKYPEIKKYTPKTNKCMNIKTSIDFSKMIIDNENGSLSVSSKERPTSIIVKEISDGLIKETTANISVEKKDNVSPDTNNKVCTKNINEVKCTSNIKIPSILSDPHFYEDYEYKFKPPNVAIYAESPDTVNNVQSVLKKVLDKDRYIIHILSKEEARSNAWRDEVILLVICGNVDTQIAAQLTEYIIDGGKLLVLCSDMLHTLLSFKTAEVRENELARFSYGKWERVHLMHDIFCYQASPVPTRFSQDHGDTQRLSPFSSLKHRYIKDKEGKEYTLDLQILGIEETWQTPSILLATLPKKTSKAIFSQIHLELDPMQYEHEEDKFKVLKENDVARLEIISHLLSTHLCMKINDNVEKSAPLYTPAYLLGYVQNKQRFFKDLKDMHNIKEDGILEMPKLKIQWIHAGDAQIPASATFLPLMMYARPTTFCPEQYFKVLKTRELGRLIIHANILTSTMNVIEKQMDHGLAVIALEQTEGQARRRRNIWLSPYNCVAFSIQIHIPKSSALGTHISLLQHMIAVALVTAVRSRQGYEDIDLRIKWPNDVYVGKYIKIGGVIVATLQEGSLHICNIGAGINLNNDKPTICINRVIRDYNSRYHKDLKYFYLEEYIALVFNELEKLIDFVQNGNIRLFYKLYYKYWMHTNSKIKIKNSNGECKKVTIYGIDDFGYLLVKGKQGTMYPVQPDGNSFDVFNGLIAPK